MTVYVAAVLFVFGVTVDLIVLRALYRRVRSAIRCRRPVRDLPGRIRDYGMQR